MQLLAERNQRELYTSLFSAGTFTLPDFFQGEVVPISFSVIQAIANAATGRIYDPVDITGYTVEVGLGNPSGLPLAGVTYIRVGPQLTSGTLTVGKRYEIYAKEAGDDFTAVFGASGESGETYVASDTTPTVWSNDSVLFEVTEDLSYDFDAQDLEAALNDTKTITDAGGVTVDAYGNAGNFLITFDETGAQATFSAYTGNLAPLSNVDIAKFITGDATRREVQHLRIIQNASAKATLSTALPAAAVVVDVLETGGRGANHKIRISLTPVPYEGKFTANIGGNESAFISYDSSAAAMTAILEAVSGIGSGNVEVVAEAPHQWVVMFIGDLADTDMGTITGDATALKVLPGFSGELDLRNPGVQLLLNGANQVETTFEITITPSGGDPFKIVQKQVRLREGLLDPNTVVPNPVDIFLTEAETLALLDDLETDVANENVRNLSGITALTGGGAGALDAIATVDVPVGRLYEVVISGVAYLYTLEAGTDAEVSPAVIRPDDYDGGTNAKVWKLLKQYLHAAVLSGTPTFVSSDARAFWQGAFVMLPYSNAASVNAAGNTSLTPPAGARVVEAKLTASAGSGTYTRNYVLAAPEAGQVCTVNLLLELAATNPTISIRNLTAGGTELLNIPPTGAAQTYGVVLRSRDGANWELFSAIPNP